MDKEPDVLIPLTSMSNYIVANGPSEVLIEPKDDHEDWREALNAMNGIDLGLIDFDDDETVPGGSQPRTDRDSEPEFDGPDTAVLDPGLLDPQPELEIGRGGDVGPRRRPPNGPDGRPSSFPKPPIYGQTPQAPGMYAVKKNIAQGMMDIALLTANGSQLRYVLRSNAYDAYYYISIVLISISIFLQIIVGFALVLNNNAEQNGIESKKRAKRINNAVVALIFLITVVNIFIASFGVEGVTPMRLPCGANPVPRDV